MRRFLSDDAVSSVLGGVLVFGLVVSFLIVVRVDYVPIWEEDREAGIASQARADLAAIKAESERQADNRTTDAVSLPIILGEDVAARMFAPPSVPAALTLEPGTARVHLETPELLLYERNGQGLGTIDEDFRAIGSSVILEDAVAFEHLRIKINNPKDEVGPTVDDPIITLTVLRQDGIFQGDATIRLTSANDDDPNSVGFKLSVTIRGPTSLTIYEGGTNFHASEDPSVVFVDLLDPALHFRDVLQAAQNPMDVVISESGIAAQYATVYYFSSGSEAVLTGESGLLVSDFVADYVGGTLRHETNPTHFLAQRQVVENGALILEQGGLRTMRGDPAFSVDIVADVTFIKWTLPSLVGQADSVTEDGTTLVTLDGVESSSFTGAAARFIIQVDSDFPEAWSAFFTEVMDGAGLDDGLGEYSVDVVDQTVTLSVWGITSAPSSSVRDVQLEMRQGAVEVDIRN